LAVRRHETDSCVLSFLIRKFEIRQMSKLLKARAWARGSVKKLKNDLLTLRMAIMGCAAYNFFPISEISNWTAVPPRGIGAGRVAGIDCGMGVC